MAAAFYNYNEKFGGWNREESPGTAVIPYTQLPPNDFKLPVIIELTVYKANWVNGSLIQFLKIACELQGDVQAFLVTFSFYMAYFVLALPALSFYIITYRQAFNHCPCHTSILDQLLSLIDLFNGPYIADKNMMQGRYNSRTSRLPYIP